MSYTTKTLVGKKLRCGGDQAQTQEMEPVPMLSERRPTLLISSLLERPPRNSPGSGELVEETLSHVETANGALGAAVANSSFSGLALVFVGQLRAYCHNHSQVIMSLRPQMGLRLGLPLLPLKLSALATYDG